MKRPAKRNKAKGKETNPIVSTKDQKVLWSRAAGRCSMPDCRRELTFDKIVGGSATLGAMCHIVGEKRNAARGKSPLKLEDRNSYPNLILLCSHHHDVIDRNSAKYPIEILHQLKAEHELWVQESLSKGKLDPDTLVFSNLVDTIATVLRLDRWVWLVDHAVRDLVHEDWFDAWPALNAIPLRTVWPTTKADLKTAILRVVNSFNAFLTNYESNAEPRNGPFMGPNKDYARRSHPFDPGYQDYEKKEEKWSDRNFVLLCDCVVSLNQFAAVVRKRLNPLFFRVKGNFLIADFEGVRFDGKSTFFLPQSNWVKKQLKRVN